MEVLNYGRIKRISNRVNVRSNGRYIQMRKIIFFAIASQFFFHHGHTNKIDVSKKHVKAQRVVLKEVPAPFVPLMMIPIV